MIIISYNNPTVFKEELTELFAEKTGITKKKSKETIAAFCELLKEQLQTGNDVNLYGFGRFTLAKIKERTYVSGLNGKKTVKPAHVQVIFKPNKDLLDK